MRKSLLALSLSLAVAGCSGLEIRPARFRSTGTSAPSPILETVPDPAKLLAPTEQLTKYDCGIASLEHAAKLWGADISGSLDPTLREKASSLNSLAALARKSGFDAFVLKAGSTGENPFAELTGHLRDERPLVVLLRLPPGIGPMMSYVRRAASDAAFSGNPVGWARHFVVLTKCGEVGENGIAEKFTMMEPGQGIYREVDSRWLELFWRRQDAKYLLISK